jgi:DNA-binding transcriptional regulator YiaG
MAKKMKTLAPKSQTQEWTGQRVKNLREAYGESQDRFAARFGLNGATVSFWETEKGKPSGSAQFALDRLAEDIGFNG